MVVPEWRAEDRIRHELPELIRQRVFAIACGYADTNDAERLSSDPIHKLLVGRDPITGGALASQPTLSRFENGVDRRSLIRIGRQLLECVVERHRRRLGRRARTITIDLDQTDDPTHGAQQMALFNGYYGNWCYLPLLGFVSFNDETDQFLAAAILRPGNAPDKRGAAGLLRRLITRLRRAFPHARIRVRLDAGFAAPDVLDLLDRQHVQYAVAMPRNTVSAALAEPLMRRARRDSRRSGQTERCFGEAPYRARSWPARRLVIKAEVTRIGDRDPKDNPRFVITNMGARRNGSMSGSTAAAETSRTASRNCTTGSRSTAPAALDSSQTSSACCSRLLPTCSCRSFGCEPAALLSPTPRFARCGTAY